METRSFPDGTVLLKAAPGEEALSAFTAALEERGVSAGSFTAIGATSEAEIAHWDPLEKKYNKQVFRGAIEVLSMMGNVTRIDGKSFVHAHVTLGFPDMSVRGGHIFRLIAHPTLEIALRPLEGAVDRVLVPEHGLRLWRL